jgi:cell division protein FtsW
MAGLALAALALASPYRLARAHELLNSWRTLCQRVPIDPGIAFGRGEWLGVGLGGACRNSTISGGPYGFSICRIAEELGLAGVLLVLGLFGYVTWRAFAIASSAFTERPLPPTAPMALGCGWRSRRLSTWASTWVLPTKGLTLPLVSYGDPAW